MVNKYFINIAAEKILYKQVKKSKNFINVAAEKILQKHNNGK